MRRAEDIRTALLGPHSKARITYNEQLRRLCGDEAATDRVIDRLPARMICPITQAPMVEPVATADGHIYEKFAITQWLDGRETSPLTGLRLCSKDLVPDIALRDAIAREVQAAA